MLGLVPTILLYCPHYLPSVAEPFRLPSAKVWNAPRDNVVSASSVDSFGHKVETFFGSSNPSAVSSAPKCTLQFLAISQLI